MIHAIFRQNKNSRMKSQKAFDSPKKLSRYKTHTQKKFLQQGKSR